MPKKQNMNNQKIAASARRENQNELTPFDLMMNNVRRQAPVEAICIFVTPDGMGNYSTTAGLSPERTLWLMRKLELHGLFRLPEGQ